MLLWLLLVVMAVLSWLPRLWLWCWWWWLWCVGLVWACCCVGVGGLVLVLVLVLGWVVWWVVGGCWCGVELSGVCGGRMCGRGDVWGLRSGCGGLWGWVRGVE